MRRGSTATRRGIAVLAALAIMLLAIALADVGGTALAGAFAIPGLILALRRPGQPIAWCLLVMAAGLALGTTIVQSTAVALVSGDVDPVGAFTAWANGTGWALVFAGLIGLLLLFPTGSLRTRWERRLAAVLTAVYLPVAIVLMFGPTLNVTLEGRLTIGVDVPNPYALSPVVAVTGDSVDTAAVWPLLGGLEGVAIAAFVWRFRRATGLERLQFRWLAWAVIWVGIASIGWALVTNVLRTDNSLLAIAIVLVSFPAIPIAITIAVLRYRLYEIDRLVSRSVGWALATAAIVAVFAAGVLAFGALLSGLAQGQAVATAAATLLAFALFQPLRSRLQRVVDRRFDRPRIEAERTLERHGEQLAHEVELDVIENGVIETVAATVRPASASLWIRSSGRRA